MSTAGVPTTSKTPPEGEASEKPLRADARRNRERVLAAAREAFAEYGREAQMDDVAQRAGVGVGTVYRHFPNKEALAEALAADRFRQLAEFAREALDVEDPWEAFSQLMWRCARLQADDRALAELMASQPEAMEEAMQRAAMQRVDLHEFTGELIRRGQEAGVLRRDVGTSDVPMILCGLGRIMDQTAAQFPTSWERYLAIVLDGLRAPATSELPASPGGLPAGVSSEAT